jgi:hypothetical protein
VVFLQAPLFMEGDRLAPQPGFAGIERTDPDIDVARLVAGVGQQRPSLETAGSNVHEPLSLENVETQDERRYDWLSSSDSRP